jgi:Holliday junction resolvase RusA-like endonuclease
VKSVSFFVPLEPVAKARPRSAIRKGKNGKDFILVYTPSKTRNYEESFASIAKSKIQWPFLGAIELRMTFTFPLPESWSRKKREAALGTYKHIGIDLDNTIKAASDSLNGIAWADDRQIVRLLAAKKYVSSYDDVSGTNVTIIELDQGNAGDQ